MDYTLDVIDTQNDELVLSLERALRSSIILAWNGGDRRDELDIIGSSLDFSMISMVNTDGAYYELFTGDETRFYVRLYDANDLTIWSGYLLPDKYSEPYESAPIPVKFKATDGLGRLKGKYLPEDFYKEEKSVIEVLSNCLKLTGLELNIRFSPAIENSVQKDYNLIYIPTKLFKDQERKEDAYKILQDLIKSMECLCYQANNYFNIEGINIGEQLVYNTKVYDYNGVFIEEQEVTRLLKTTTNLATPNVTMQPPVGFLSVAHERVLLELPETLSGEENDGWTYRNEGESTIDSTTIKETDSIIYALDWFGNDGHYAYSGNDNSVFFTYASASFPINDQLIELKNTIYIQAAKKYRFKGKFKINPISDDEEVNKQLIADELWQNPFLFSLFYVADTDYYEDIQTLNFLGIVPILTNDIPDAPTYISLNFGLNEKLTIDLDFYFIPQYDGVFNIKILPLETGRGIDEVYLEDFTLELIGEKETLEVSGTPIEGWTTKKEFDIEYGSDVNGFSKAFRLAKLDTILKTSTIKNNIIREFDYKGKHYVSVPLFTANLVDENRDSVRRSTVLNPEETNPVVILDVIYNFNNSDEHVLVTQDPVFTDIIVDVYRRGVDENRIHWDQWTDAVYQVEKINYVQAVYNVNERLLNKELPAILNLNVKNNVKFDDIIAFKYRNKNQWTISNCKWDIDRGFTDLTVRSRYYISDGEYPPIVETDGVVFTYDNQVGVNVGELNSYAHDPDGFITKFLWEKVDPNSTSVIQNPNAQNTFVSLPDGVFYDIFRITVTDNDGYTASALVEMYKRNDVEITLTEIFTASNEVHYKINVLPEIPENTSINIKGKLVSFISVLSANKDGELTMTSTLEQNGVIQNQCFNLMKVKTGESKTLGKFNFFSANYLKGDELIVKFLGTAPFQFTSSISQGIIYLSGASYNEGFGSVEIIDEKKLFEY